MSFGYGVGDLIAVGVLAWNVYKSCKEAPESYGRISLEVLSLHAVLKEAEETVFTQPLSPTKQEHLKAVGDGCYCVLKDLDNLCEKYQSLGTQSKRTWDRMRLGTEDIAELRARLTSNTGLLTAWIIVSQANVEKKLNHFSQECREGKREASVISTQTSDTLSMNDKQLWRAIRKELEDIGITVAAFDANKDFIFEWFTNAIANGALEERTFEPCEDSSDEQFQGVQFTSGVRLEARQREAPVSQISSPRIGPSNVGATSPSKDATGNKLPVPLPQEVAIQRPRIPRVAALIARLTRPNHSLITAVEECDMLKMCEILYDPRKVVWLDSESFCMAVVWAAGRGEEQVVRLLIEKGADVNGCDAFGSSALHLASENGHEQVVRLLIENGADVNARDATYEKSPLHYASKYGHEQVVRLLVEKGADVNAHDADRKTAVHFASQNGHEQVVQLLIEKGVNVNADNAYQNSMLHLASQNGHEQVVQLLIKKGADINARDVTYERKSPLHYASQIGHTQVVQLLIEKGANINADDGFGRSALHLASESGHEQVVRLLIEKGADINACNAYMRSTLHYASQNGHKAVVQLLIEKGADVNACDATYEKKSPLHYASQNGHKEVVQLLIEKGADINACDATYEKKSPLHYALENGHKQVVQLLEAHHKQNLTGSYGILARDHGCGDGCFVGGKGVNNTVNGSGLEL